MKNLISLIGQSNITKRKMNEVVIQTAEPDSTQEATERMFKIFESTYAKADLNQVSDNVTQLNA